MLGLRRGGEVEMERERQRKSSTRAAEARVETEYEVVVSHVEMSRTNHVASIGLVREL